MTAENAVDPVRVRLPDAQSSGAESGLWRMVTVVVTPRPTMTTTKNAIKVSTRLDHSVCASVSVTVPPSMAV